MTEELDPALVARVFALIPALELGGIDWPAVDTLRTLLASDPGRLLPSGDQQVQQIAFLLHRAGETDTAIGIMNRVLGWHLQTGHEPRDPEFALTNLKWLHDEAGHGLTDDEIRQQAQTASASSRSEG
jgi:hypothetical protein